MKHKETNNFTAEEKDWMDTLAINYIIAQSDGFQLGYAQALADFTENIIRYWQSTDDNPQQSILDLLVELGMELGKRKQVAEKNIEAARERGYEQYYHWTYKKMDSPFSITINLFTKAEVEPQAEGEDNNDAKKNE